MWKPTKAGYYRFGDGCRDVWVDRSRLMTRAEIHGDNMPVSDGPWSLMGPDWQDGPPTLEQLGRWQWWAVVNDTELLLVGKWRTWNGMMYSSSGGVLPGVVSKSAPVQPVPGEALWVPLEVCK